MFYYTFTTFDCNFIPRNAEICKVSSETKNVGKAHKYRLNRHLPTYEKIIKNLYSFLSTKKTESEITLTPAFLFITFMYLSSSSKKSPIFTAGGGCHSPMRLSISFNRNNFCPVSNGSVRFSLYCFIFSIVVP